MLSAKLSLFFFLAFIFFSQSASGSLQTGLQFVSENTYRNTLNPIVVFEPKTAFWLSPRFSVGSGFSDKDWETFGYRMDLDIPLFDFFSISLRMGQRLQLPETFSRTSLLGFARLETTLFERLSLFFAGGWYKRWVQLNRASILPLAGTTSFSEHDFATELGLLLKFTRTQIGLRVATFDELDVYNLNNPYIESRIFLPASSPQGRWSLLCRYHLSLGFGRLDKLTTGISYWLVW